MFWSGWPVRLSRDRADFRRFGRIGDLRLVVGRDEGGAGQAQQRRRIGKTPTTSVRAFDLFIEPF
jgi:hypothetical protein